MSTTDRLTLHSVNLACQAPLVYKAPCDNVGNSARLCYGHGDNGSSTSG